MPAWEAFPKVEYGLHPPSPRLPWLFEDRSEAPLGKRLPCRAPAAWLASACCLPRCSSLPRLEQMPTLCLPRTRCHGAVIAGLVPAREGVSLNKRRPASPQGREFISSYTCAKGFTLWASSTCSMLFPDCAGPGILGTAVRGGRGAFQALARDRWQLLGRQRTLAAGPSPAQALSIWKGLRGLFLLSNQWGFCLALQVGSACSRTPCLQGTAKLPQTVGAELR